MLFQDIDGFHQCLACQQFGRVGRYGSAGEDAQGAGYPGGLHHRHQVGGLRAGQELGDSFFFLREVEDLVESRLADVDYSFAQQREADGEVGGYKCFSFAADGRGDQDDFILFAQHKLQVGADTPEGFRHQAVFVFADSDASRFPVTLFGQGDVSDDGGGGQLFHIGPSFYPELEQPHGVDDGYGDAHPHDEGYHIDRFGLGRNGTVVRHGLVYDLGVVGSGGQCDGVFFPFLQQHQVESGFDLLLPGDADELAFLRGRIADAAVELAGLTVEVGLGDQQSFLNAVDGGQDVFAHGTDAAIQVHDHRVAFRGVA